MKRTVPVVIGVISFRDTFLMTLRTDADREDSKYRDCWQFPGGGIEFGESPEAAIKREIREETGITLTRVGMIPEILTETRQDWHGIFIVFTSSLDQKPPIILNSEASAYGWYTLAEIRKLRTLPLTHEIALSTLR